MDTTILDQPRAPFRPAPLPGPRPSGVVRLEQLTRVLRRHAWLIGAFALLGGVGAYGYARTLPKQYTATSLFTVEGDRFAIPELQGALRSDNSPDPMPWVRTEVQALTSRVLVGGVAEKLHLDQVVEFNPALQPPTILERLKDWIAPALPGGPADAPPSGPDEGVINGATRALGVFQDNRSLVISVYFHARDPRLAAAFVNQLVGDYIQSRAQRRVDANLGANTALTGRIDQARSGLASIEGEITALRDSSGLVDVRAGTVGQQRLEELTTAAARATLERGQLQVSYERAATVAKGGSSDALASVLNSPTVSRLRDQEGTAQRRLADLSTRYGSGYPSVRAAEAELGTARRQIAAEANRIVSSLGDQLRVARAQEADVQQQLAAAQKAGVASESVRAKLVQLQQEAATRRSLYQTLLERSQQTVVQPAALNTPDVRVLSPAVPPGSPSGPRTGVAGLLGGAGGAVLGMLLALTRLPRADLLATEGELTAQTGLTVLATVPGRLLGRKAALSRPQMDAMRTLRERLRFAGRGGRPRIVAVTPVHPGDATAPAAALALARTAALDGEKVLLLELDGTAAVSRQLGFPGTGGLERALSGEDWREALQTDGATGLQILQGGGGSPDGLAVLRGTRFQNLLLDARNGFDLLVLTTPVATGPSAAALAQRADLVLLAIPSGTGRGDVEEASRLADVAHAPIAAVLVSRA